MAKPVGRGWTLSLTVLATLLISVPTAVWASHQFTDVPDSHTFHNAIDWMKDNNITVGCNPPANSRYCPDDNVTRGQMAAFMKRLAENKVVNAATATNADHADTATNADHADTATNADDADTLAGLDATQIAPISVVAGTTELLLPPSTAEEFTNIQGAQTTITVPEGYKATVIARFMAESACLGGDWASVVIELDGIEMAPKVQTNHKFDSHDEGDTSGSSWESHGIERFQTGVSAGTHTVRARYNSGCTTHFHIDNWTLVAEAKLVSKQP